MTADYTKRRGENRAYWPLKPRLPAKEEVMLNRILGISGITSVDQYFAYLGEQGVKRLAYEDGVMALYIQRQTLLFQIECIIAAAQAFLETHPNTTDALREKTRVRTEVWHALHERVETIQDDNVQLMVQLQDFENSGFLATKNLYRVRCGGKRGSVVLIRPSPISRRCPADP